MPPRAGPPKQTRPSRDGTPSTHPAHRAHPRHCQQQQSISALQSLSHTISEQPIVFLPIRGEGLFGDPPAKGTPLPRPSSWSSWSSSSAFSLPALQRHWVAPTPIPAFSLVVRLGHLLLLLPAHLTRPLLFPSAPSPTLTHQAISEPQYNAIHRYTLCTRYSQLC
jgi:hypothetical protein